MRGLLTSGVAVTALLLASGGSRPSSAASMSVFSPILFDWSGFYIGGTLGGAWGTFDPASSTMFTGAYLPAPDVAAVNAAGRQSFKSDGVGVGAEVGYNWETGNFVYGLESDLQSIRLSGHSIAGPNHYVGIGPTFMIAANASANWLFTTRPRVGFAYSNWLFYATGGLAVTNLNGAAFAFNDVLGTSEGASLSETKAGYAVGGGMEVGFGDRWSLKADYLYVDFNTVSVDSNNLVAFPTVPAPGPGQPFTHSVDLKANIARIGLNYRFPSGSDSPSAAATGAASVLNFVVKAPLPAMAWSWAGLYFGAHVGASWGTTSMDDPFSQTEFGDNVRTPGFLGGGQIGYNWQQPGSRWVYGVEAALSGLDSDGTATCFATSAAAINETCRVRPSLTGTLTGRIGATIYQTGRTLVYGKAGLAFVNDRIDMATGNTFTGIAGPGIASNSSSVNVFGWTLGLGLERALTPAWSMNLEYDYLEFGGHNIANLGSSTYNGAGTLLSTTPPGTSGFTQNVQIAKLGLNYRWGADPRATGWSAPARPYPVKAAPTLAVVEPGWSLEGGGRYVGSWNIFHKDLGAFVTAPISPLSSVSRLTYDDMESNGGEFFGRIDSPWNLFVKGYIGGSRINDGHLNDEDFGTVLFGAYVPYSNTLSPVVTGQTSYGVIDGGYDFLHGPGYKLDLFAGYFRFNETMKGFGCTPLANANCFAAVPITGDPIIAETDHWDALRTGIAGEMMITDRLKLSGEVAYLPYVTFKGIDDHYFANTGIIANINPEWGHGDGVQADVLASYYVTPQFSIGIGGRYWGLWTAKAEWNRTFDATGIPTPTPPQNYKAVAEQAGAFVQAAYKFGN